MRCAGIGPALCALATMACGDGAGPPPPTPDCGALIGPIGSGFGARGPHRVEVRSLPNPRWPDLAVTVHLPVGAAQAPVVVFAHGNGLPDPLAYQALLDHIASRGYAAIHSPYAVESEHRDRYAALWSGVEAAIQSFGARFDLARIGFVGHSYGAGAVPYLAHRALVERGWGSAGAFMLVMAPWYRLYISDAELLQLPRELIVTILNFESDTVNDHRIAIDLFRALPAGVPKTYLTVRSDGREGCVLTADHAVPQSAGLGGRRDALDERAVFRLFDALAAAAFEGDVAAEQIALGRGTAEQLDMGRWLDGTPMNPLVFGDDPQPIRPESSYLFQHSDRADWERYGVTAEGR